MPNRSQTPPKITQAASARLFGVSAADLSQITSVLRALPPTLPTSQSERRAAIADAIRQRDPIALDMLIQIDPSTVRDATSRTGQQIGLFALCLENFNPDCADILLRHLSPRDIERTDIDAALGGRRGFCTPQSGAVYVWLRTALPTLKDIWTDPDAESEGRLLASFCKHAFAIQGDLVLPDNRSVSDQKHLLDVFEFALARAREIRSSMEPLIFEPSIFQPDPRTLAVHLAVMSVTLGDFDRAARLFSDPRALETYALALHQDTALMSMDHLIGFLGFLDSPQAAAIGAPNRIESVNLARTVSPASPEGVPLLWTVFLHAPFGHLLLDLSSAATRLAEIVVHAPHRMTRLFDCPSRSSASAHFDRMIAFVDGNIGPLAGVVDQNGSTVAHHLAKTAPPPDPWDPIHQPPLADRFFAAALALGGPEILSTPNKSGLTPVQLLPSELQPLVTRLALAATAEAGLPAPSRRF